MTKMPFQQESVAVLGFSCRLPGDNDSPQKLWEFLKRGEVASNHVPASRFNISGHYDGSHKPGTMRPPGGMFLGGIDLAEFDAGFFEIAGTEAIAMDPNQRQMLEVVVEALENAGLPLEKLNGAPVACYVGSYASDYGDMQNRDPEDRPANYAIGVGRAIMANRISYFLNIKGPSVTIDTACSGSLVGLDLACRSIQSGEVDTAIVAASNIYLNPEHVIDTGSIVHAHSPSGYCHTFDVEADGYIKAEGVSCVVVKRLTDAVRDRDPVRAIVRGTASNSNGRTGGIASPNSDAQAAAIRAAYKNAGIVDFNATAYLECHGTGTQAGDSAEVKGIGSVFASSRLREKPLFIGSIKSNIGHSEPAAGNSGLIKVIMSMERGTIPGTPLFIKPNPKIDFEGWKVEAFRTAIPWPDMSTSVRRASINSFGYGGSNAHAIVEQPALEDRCFHVSSYKHDDADDMFDDEEVGERPYTLVISANDAHSLQDQIRSLCNHLANPRVKVNLPDLAYTLSERRTCYWHRAFLTTKGTELDEKDFSTGKFNGKQPGIAFVFTGQGGQWPQMGRSLLQQFPWTRGILEELDFVLHAQADPPQWSLVSELTEPRTSEHMRRPEFSQTLVTALQLCLIAVMDRWGVKADSVVGHSSGEIAAAYTAGLLSRASAIKAAFYRGRAAASRQYEIETNVGMLAVGLGPEEVTPFMDNYIGSVWIACFNSPKSVTLSGMKSTLEFLREDLNVAGHFARVLQVDLAYHSPLVDDISKAYETLLCSDGGFGPERSPQVRDSVMFSTVTGCMKTDAADALYWKTNMVSPVHFSKALRELITQTAPGFIIEIGPSDALSGPVSQVVKSALAAGENIGYSAAWRRGVEPEISLFNTAGRLFTHGCSIDLAAVNNYDLSGETAVRTIVDLPNYSWNHTIRYWHENAVSKDWRTKRFVTHDLLGSKIPGTSWQAPTWRKQLNLRDVPWLRDHKMGSDVLIPGAGLAAMALEAMYQKYCVLNPGSMIAAPNELAYRFRDVKFSRAVIVEEEKPTTLMLTMQAMPGDSSWNEFKIRTAVGETIYDNCSGLICVQDPIGEEESLEGDKLAPLRYAQPAHLWYEAQHEVGMGFGPAFQKIKQIESVSGSRTCRSIVSMVPPASKWDPQSHYPAHPAVLDGCLQTATPANAAGERILIKDTMIPSLIDDMVINKMPHSIEEGLSIAESVYTGRGRIDVAKSWTANISIHDLNSGALLVRVSGLNYIRLDVEENPDTHVFQTVAWHPDISFLDRDRLLTVHSEAQERSDIIQTAIDFVAAKKPTLNVLEMNLEGLDDSTLWARADSDMIRAAYAEYHFACVSPEALVSVQDKLRSKRDAYFHLLNPAIPSFGLPASGNKYDLVILKGRDTEDTLVKDAINFLKPLLRDYAYTLLSMAERSKFRHHQVPLLDGTSSPEMGDTLLEDSSGAHSPLQGVDSMARTETSQLSGIEHSQSPLWKDEKTGFFSSAINITEPSGPGNAFLCPHITSQDGDQCRKISIARFKNEDSVIITDALDRLRATGWDVETAAIEDTLSFANSSISLVIEGSSNSVLMDLTEGQWGSLQDLISMGNPLLWVTHGSQKDVITEPTQALVHGLFRVIRRENRQAKVTTLDVHSLGNPSAAWAIDQVLQKLSTSASFEKEYTERRGIIYLQRLLVDQPVNDFKAAENGKGLEPVVTGLHASKAQVRIQAEKVGTLRSLTWCETAVDEIPMEPGMVDLEVVTVGVNFKDVATTIGIVPENEHMIGCECAGFVRRIASGLETSLRVGDRVAAMRSGAYANRVQCPHERVRRIPDSMSFEDAATIPLAYLTAIYSLYHLGNLTEAQTVLIHSAAGGVGIAAIQLAQYKKCDVFVTVGTDSKREFLSRQFGIRENRIFNSRNKRFAEEIRRETGGRGVDMVLNSLTGDLLDESWRLVADGGTMVEIGKRDIVDRNTLAMEPFGRNCSFRAVDFSYVATISNELVGRLMKEVFDLVEGGHIGAIHPISVYGFDEVVEALSYMRRGEHIGKIVISSKGQQDIKLPIRPAIRTLSLDPEAIYVIVGGLKGVCGSVAVHFARHGARHITVVSRSGSKDEASARVIMNCAAQGCIITDAIGDVGDMDFTRALFRRGRPRRVAGVVQGAMVLRDKSYTTMSYADFVTCIHPKVVGTWNLHKAAVVEQSEALDFFTMLSSISSIVGNKGQANYVAANAFLDAFASFRLHQGLAANTVNLGVITDVGYVAKQAGALEAYFDKKLWMPIREGTLRRIITYSIFQQMNAPLNPSSRSQLITGLVFPLLVDNSDLKDDRRFGYLARKGGVGSTARMEDESATDQSAQAVRAFTAMKASGADVPALVNAAVGLLAEEMVRVLRLETQVEPSRPLVVYGIDSLSAVEIRGWIKLQLGVELSTLEIMNASSIIALGEKLISKLPESEAK
ncbi:putative polyketide synthase [Xylariaceae sp. FL0255]|nr:putative polyketide synthase [Xylariaceae sp. FL0255]